MDKQGIKLFVDMFSAQYLNGITIDHTYEYDGLRVHIREPERHRRLWLRHVVLRLRSLHGPRVSKGGTFDVSLPPLLTRGPFHFMEARSITSLFITSRDN